ncbi:hypothetical protein FB567DRAFT_454425, partial [Paraphoma chrysanthemicola]
PKLASVQHSNTVKGRIRNMGIEDGMVYVATRYYKGYNISGDVNCWRAPKKPMCLATFWRCCSSAR